MSNSSILGDSWVVEAAASPSPKKHKHKHEAGSPRQFSSSQAPRATTDQTKKPQSPRDTKSHEHGSESATASVSSSISGPELIMPSIYETPVPEASWVAPNVRSPRQTSSVKRRHPAREDRDDRSSRAPNASPRKMHQNETQKKSQTPHSNHTKPSLVHRMQPILRILLNALLAAAIAHLLVLPELITQHQSLFCSIPAIPSLYPASCTPHPQLFTGPVGRTTGTTLTNTNNNNAPPSREEQLTRLATHLERLFTQTLTNLTPLPAVLKKSETRLRSLQSDLRASFPGRRHELDLEFSGLWEAARTGSRKFDSLRADLQSAVDNLIATGTPPPPPPGDGAAAGVDATRGSRVETPKNKNPNQKRKGGEQQQHEAINANAKAQARAVQITSAQLTRREGYLDQLTSRMQDKADALASDLATFEDHLESIEGIIKREESSTHPFSSTSSSETQPDEESAQPEGKIPLLSHLRALSLSFPFPFPFSVRQAASQRSDRSARETLVAATTGHRAIAEAVRNLSQRLEAVQRRKTG